MVVIEKIEKKQDIYIIGYTCETKLGELKAVSITDDYNSLSISNGDDQSNIETEGSFYILNEKQFKAYKEKIAEDYGNDDDELSNIEYYFLPDFKGSIGLKVISENEIDVLEEFDEDQMLMEQVEFEDGDYWYDAVIEIIGDYEVKTLAD